MNFFDLSLQFKGFDIKNAKAFLKQNHEIAEANYGSFIEVQKNKITTYHLNNNPFYKAIAKNATLNDWNSLPIMTKRDLQIPLENRLSKEFNKRNVYINKTSGSSGDPFVFAKDKWCHALTWAVILNRFSWYGIDFNNSKQARFYGIPLDKKGYYIERLKDWFANRFRFSVFDLSDKAFEKVLLKFKNTSFNYINGYTSPIVQFAKYLEREKVILNKICPSLQVCMVTSEMLFETDRKIMETYFGVPIINEYGASELDLIAFQNKNGDLQLNNETLYVEIVDENDQPLPNGQEGRIIITSLYNRAHPFIRYDIGDFGVISEKSSDKIPILEKLIGRTNDIALLPSGRKAAGLTFYYITKSIIEDDGNVKEFIIEQTSINHFTIKYVSVSELNDEKKKIIKKEMINYLEAGIDITFERNEKLKRSSSGKLKQFVSHLTNF